MGPATIFSALLLQKKHTHKNWTPSLLSFLLFKKSLFKKDYSPMIKGFENLENGSKTYVAKNHTNHSVIQYSVCLVFSLKKKLYKFYHCMLLYNDKYYKI